MDRIADWLKQVAAVVILAGFLEMILPANAMKNVVKLVMGLVIIAILLQPLLMVFQIPVILDWPSATAVNEEATQDVVAAGLDLRTRWEDFYQKQYQAKLEATIREQIRQTGKAEVTASRFDFNEGRLKRAMLVLRPTVPLADEVRKSLKNQITGWLGLMTGISDQQIEVKWHD
ncbi:MAG TPA: stage III sporulation protein AF [Bacillota bacterium]|nr:stage III sporulation protein AF [Bacillota bacterium]